MQNFIRVKAYDKCTDEYKETFVNLERISFLTTLDEDNVRYFMVYFEDLALRVSPNSYVLLVRMVYGEDYDL